MQQLEFNVGNKLDFAMSLSVKQVAMLRGTDPHLYNIVVMARREASRLYKEMLYYEGKVEACKTKIAVLEKDIQSWTN